MHESIIESLKERGEIAELIGEGNDRIVFAHAKNPQLIVKVPKSDYGIQANKFEASHYQHEEFVRVRMWKQYFPNGLARCALVGECLYMQRLDVRPGSDFGTMPIRWEEDDGVVRRFDLNPF